MRMGSAFHAIFKVIPIVIDAFRKILIDDKIVKSQSSSTFIMCAYTT